MSAAASAPSPSLIDALPEPLGPPRGCTHFQLRQLMRRVGLIYDAELAAVGLKTSQYSLLSSVMRLGPVRPGDLAAAMKMEPSTLTRNLKPLIASGWVQLRPGVDGRSRAVEITDSGRALRERARRHWRIAQDRLNDRLGVQRVAALHALIEESLTLLDTPDEDLADD